MSLVADAALTFKIKAALIADERIGAGNINVNTASGVVTLLGHVPYEAIRELAEAVAIRNGAHQVINELRVDHPEHHAESRIIPDDAPHVTTSAGAEVVEGPSLQEAVHAALTADSRVNEHLVVIQIDNGVAYLSGRQDTIQAWEAVTEIVTHVPGINGVVNDIEVMPSV